MRKPSNFSLLFNGAALLVVGASGLVVLRSIFTADEIAACSTRYGHGTQLALERARGDLLTPADLQARFGGTDWGLLENARVVEIKGGPAGQAIEVRFAKLTGPSGGARSGMGFTWAPRLMGQQSSACLAYSVLMPPDFDVAKGGRLPGFAAAASDRDAEKGFSARPGWREQGTLDAHVQLGGWSEVRRLTDDRAAHTFTRGRWVALEQELILNTPGQKDGVLRIWADGALKLEKTGLVFRDNADLKISNVLVEAAMGNGADAPKEQRLWLSPLELRWQ